MMKKAASKKVSTVIWIAALGSLPTIATADPTGADVISEQRSREAAQSRDRFVLGIGTAAVPTFQGSDEYRSIPVPFIDISYGRFFADLKNGVGFKLLETPAFTFGTSLNYTQGYRGRDVPEGIGKLSTGVGARAFTGVRAGGFVANLGVTQGLSGGTEGAVADASLARPIVLSKQLILVASVAGTWADEKHNDRYFGISAEQSAASGLPEHHLKGGAKDVSVGIAATYRVTDRLGLTASVTNTTLLADVKDSPLVKEESSVSGLFAISYRMGR